MTEQPDPDTCRTVIVDGQPVSVRGNGDWTDADRDAFAEIVRAVRRKYEGSHDRPEEKR